MPVSRIATAGELIVEQWQVGPTAGRCMLTGREFLEGEEYYAVLFEDGEGFRREDVSIEAWQGPPDGAFCCFKTRIAVKTKAKRLWVDDEVLVSFFQRLADEEELARLQFRFVLALILMRKRVLKYERTTREGESEFWVLRLVKDRTEHSVLNPRLADEEIDSVSRQLGAILHGDVKADWTLDDAEPPADE
jgi:hypothetical protein